MKNVVLFLCFALLCLPLFGHDHFHGDGWHGHDRVYVNHPWYHHDHVIIYNNACYPVYYGGYPYYYYVPQYYYNANPSVSLNVNIGG